MSGGLGVLLVCRMGVLEDVGSSEGLKTGGGAWDLSHNLPRV